MVVISHQDQLKPSTFENTVHYRTKNKLDFSFSHPRRCAYRSV